MKLYKLDCQSYDTVIDKCNKNDITTNKRNVCVCFF